MNVEMTEFEMTAEQHARLLDACRPTPAMWLSGGVPISRSPQENANDAWRVLGDELGFDWKTVTPSPRGERFFEALAVEGERA